MERREIEIKYYQHGFYQVLTRMRSPGFFLRWSGKVFCHWTFLPELRHRGFEFNPGPELKRLTEHRKELIACKTKVPAFDYRKYFVEGKQPYDFQLMGMEFMYQTRKTILADDVGLGKTLQTIGTTMRAFEEDRINVAFVITPSGLKSQWSFEFQDILKKRYLTNLKILYVRGDSKDREHIYRQCWKRSLHYKVVLIFNYELLLRDQKWILQLLKRAKKRAVICDEASRIKNRESKTHQMIYKCFGQAEYKYALSATPIENGLEDLYGIMHLLHRRIFWDDNFFARRHLEEEVRVNHNTGNKYKSVVSYKRLGELRFRLNPYYIQRTTDDVDEIDLPDIRINSYPVKLTTKQQKLYNRVLDETEAEMAMMKQGALLKRLIRLRSVCCSPNLFEGFSGEKSAKAEELKQLLSTQLKGKKIILFSERRQYIIELEKELKSFKPLVLCGGMKTNELNSVKHAYLAGRCNLLLATTAGEYGHNLPNTDFVINADIPYNPARMRQRIGRARRINTKAKSIGVINLYAEGTIEERVFEIFHQKAELFQKIFDDSFDLSRVNITKWSSKQLRELISTEKKRLSRKIV